MLRAMSKLTLNVNDAVIRRAKVYAAAIGTSVSQLVERYLDTVSRPRGRSESDDPPVLRLLREVARGVDLTARRWHQLRKYR